MLSTVLSRTFDLLNPESIKIGLRVVFVQGGYLRNFQWHEAAF